MAYNYILNVLIALIILSLGNFVFDQGKQAYYAYAPIENFYVNESFFASDVCLGDAQQQIVSTRHIIPDVDGYPATASKELFLISRGMQTKVYDEVSTPFVERTSNGVVTRTQQIPTWLEVGDYQWILKVTIEVNGVRRDDVPLIQSNIFKVLDCSLLE